MESKFTEAEIIQAQREAMTFFGHKEGSKLTFGQRKEFEGFVWTRLRSLRTERQLKTRFQTMGNILARMLPSIVGPVESPIEVVMALALKRNAKTKGFKLQLNIGPYRVDFAFPKKRIIVECDGRKYHSSPADMKRDQRRDKYLSSLGWRILRFSGRTILLDADTCVKQIAKLL